MKKHSLARHYSSGSVSPKAAKLVSRAQAALTRSRRLKNEIELTAWGKIGLFSVSMLTGAIEGKLPLSFLNVPTKVWGAAVGYLSSYLTRGGMSRAFMGGADALFAIYTYKATAKMRAGEASPLIAGDDDDEVGFLGDV